MKTWVRKTLSVGVLAAGALLFAPVAAQADTGQSTRGNNGIGNGSQIVAPISVPLTVAGIGLGILGEGNGFGAATTGRHGESGHVGQDSSDNNGILNGSQVYAPIDAPVTIAGVGLGVAGEGNGTGITSSGRRSTEDGRVGQSSSDNNGILNGSQVYAPIEAPVTIAGVGAGVLGEGNGTGVVTPGAPSGGGHNGGGGWNGGGDHDGGWNDGGGHDGSGDVGQDSSGNNGIANGTQAYLPISVPINVAGVGLGVLGEGNGTGAVLPRRSSENGHTGGGNVGQSSSDNNGIGNGSQVVAPVDAPVNVCGVGVGILGLGNGGALCAADQGHKPGHGDNDDDSWNGQHATDDQSDDAATSDAATSDAATSDAATSDAAEGDAATSDTTDGEAAEGDATEGDADTESTPVDGVTGGSDTAGTAGSSLVGNLGGLLDTLR